ncbi:thiol reductant ABC exporter subunit CydC [Humidisolicoccus flavus]|uniref:thiol reductant ABC exporter subunit CydC n=1 Tax=Humidisolicoccus flavus TaxID=3111414 RepID=UPI003244AB65
MSDGTHIVHDRPGRSSKSGFLATMLRSERRRLLGALAAGTGAALSAIALLAAASWLLAEAWKQPPILHLQMVIVGVRFFALARASGRYLERLTSHSAAFRMLGTVRLALFERLRPVAPAGLGRRSTELLSRFVDDVDRLQDWPLRVVQPLVVSSVSALISVAVVFWILPVAGTVLVIALAIAFVLGTVVSVWIADRNERAAGPLAAQLQSALIDHMRGLKLLTAYGAVENSQRNIDALDAQLRTVQTRRASLAGLVGGIATLLAGVAVVAVLAFGQAPLVAGLVDGSFLALCALVPLAIFEVWAAIPNAALAYRRVRTSDARLADLVPEGVSGIPKEVGSRVRPEGDLRVQGATVAWPGGTAVQAPVDATARPGETLVITGASGSGKSTLAAALVGFLDYAGSITIGGTEIREVHPDTLREVVTLVEQRPHLFNESLRQNLLFARDTADDEALFAVLDRVGLGAWARARGLDTPLGERGDLVSGGQAGRIALARALLRETPILVLDEPAANVDPEHADALLRDLIAAARGANRTVVAITHSSFDALGTADRVEVVAAQPAL